MTQCSCPSLSKPLPLLARACSPQSLSAPTQAVPPSLLSPNRGAPQPSRAGRAKLSGTARGRESPAREPPLPGGLGKGKTLGFAGISFFSKRKCLPPPLSREKVKEGTWAAGKSCRGGDCGFRGRTVCGTGQGEVRRVGLFREVVGGRGPKLAPSLLTGEPSPPFSAPRVELQAPVRMEQWCGGPTMPALG